MYQLIIKYGRKIIKYGLRGGATIYIPLFLWGAPLGFLGLSAAIQCGLLLRVPLILIWFQTLIAWSDDILRWVGAQF